MTPPAERRWRWMGRALAIASTGPPGSVPAGSTPDRSVPDTSAPDRSVPDTSAPDRSVPAGDVPVGAVVYGRGGTELASGRNERELTGDPTAHAEMVALRRAAARVGSWRLTGCTLVVTLEPCTMCAGALVAARVDTLVFGAWEPKTGAVGSLWDVVRDRRLTHRLEVYGGVREAECAALLRDFFRTGPDGGSALV